MSVPDNSNRNNEQKPHKKEKNQEETRPNDAPSKDTPLDEMSDQEKIEALIQELSEKEDESGHASDDHPEAKSKRITEQIRALMEKAKKDTKAKDETPKTPKQDRPKRRILMIQLGGAFHGNFTINLIMLYLVNLVVILGLLEGLGLGQFPSELWIPITFVLIYTTSEVLFKEYMVMHFSKYILMTFGFIFYFGYVILFYLVDALIFFNVQIFAGEAELAVFTLLFMLARQVMSILIKKGLAVKL